MTDHRKLKHRVRERQRKTGESYTAARRHVLRERALLTGLPAEEPASPERARADAVILMVHTRSARVRLVGEERPIIFRSRDVHKVVPGHVATLAIDKRWSLRGAHCASGRIESQRIDVAALELPPLRLEPFWIEDLRSTSEGYEQPDPYAALWRELTAEPRPSFRMDPIAWGSLPGQDDDESPICDAVEFAASGDPDASRRKLMDVLGRDLRCIDAHAHLGSLELETDPARALVHYTIGIQFGELALPPGFDGLLLWGPIYNRPFLRCLHGYGLASWRLGELDQAERTFERILRLNPPDNQGARFCWDDVRRGRSWDAAVGRATPSAEQPPGVH